MPWWELTLWMLYLLACGILGGLIGTHTWKRRRRDADRRAQADHQGAGTGEGARTTGAGAGAGTGPHPGLEVVEQDDPVRAWKVVELRADGHTVWIASAQLGVQVDLTEQARCEQPHVGITFMTAQHGPVPRLKCTCGFYALKGRPIAGPAQVTAEVDLYGTIIEAELGYRAEWQRILSLTVPGAFCHGGFLCPDRPEVVVFEPNVTLAYRQGQAFESRSLSPLPVCAAHAVGQDHVATLGQLAGRLGVEVRWDREDPDRG